MNKLEKILGVAAVVWLGWMGHSVLKIHRMDKETQRNYDMIDSLRKASLEPYRAKKHEPKLNEQRVYISESPMLDDGKYEVTIPEGPTRLRSLIRYNSRQKNSRLIRGVLKNLDNKLDSGNLYYTIKDGEVVYASQKRPSN